MPLSTCGPKDPSINRAARLEATVDHLVWATPDLDDTVARVREEWGIEPTVGGSHDGLGSRNVLLALGGATYLESVGPDPAQPDPPGPRPFGIDDLREPTLVAWAAGVPDIDLWIEWARRRGVDPGDAFAMQRTTPDGRVLRWRLTAPPADGDGVLPFLIEWPGVTPAATAARGCELVSLDLAHPDPAFASRLAEYAVPVGIARGDRALTATILTPTGIITL